MKTDIKDDPIYELRFYSVAPGRMRDMEARVQQDLRTIFPSHGIVPLGGWSVLAGPSTPMYVYLTPFRHMQERAEKWAGFYSDPAWAQCRARTNNGSELVERYDIVFLRPASEWVPVASDAQAPALMEMVVQQVAMGQTTAVRQELLQGTLSTLQGAGATVHGLFDVMSGRPLPSVVYFVGWHSLDQRAQALEALDRRTQEARSQGRAPLLERADQYLMRHVPVDWAKPI